MLDEWVTDITASSDEKKAVLSAVCTQEVFQYILGHCTDSRIIDTFVSDTVGDILAIADWVSDQICIGNNDVINAIANNQSCMDQIVSVYKIHEDEIYEGMSFARNFHETSKEGARILTGGLLNVNASLRCIMRRMNVTTERLED